MSVGIKYYRDLLQGTDEWREARCGLLTASEMKHIITPAKLQYAQNDKERGHLFELAAQRVNKYVEPTFKGFDMMRGDQEEIYARDTYSENYAQVDQCGFVTNDRWGFTIGCSPDGLIAEEGQIESKSRKQKLHIETILAGRMPEEFLIQVQTALLVTERSWCDFISYCGGMHMLTLRIEPDKRVQDAIIAAATIFHEKLNVLLQSYEGILNAPGARLIPTERKLEEEIHL